MSEIDVIRQIAQQVMSISTLSGSADNWLWDRAQRLVRNAEHICRLPEIAGANLAIDRFALSAAAYFAESGFARYLDVEDAGSRFVLADMSPADLHDFSAQVVNDKLSGALAGPKIDKITTIIAQSSDRFTDMIEAKILSDARNLDDIGAVGIFNEFRRYSIHGNGVAEVMESWKRKVDYRYWQVRLKESFHYDAVRKIASQRFSVTEYFMNQLGVENNARDLEEVVIESLDMGGNK